MGGEGTGWIPRLDKLTKASIQVCLSSIQVQKTILYVQKNFEPLLLPVHAMIDLRRRIPDPRPLCLHCSNTATQRPCGGRDDPINHDGIPNMTTEDS